VIYIPESIGYSSPSYDHPRSDIPYAEFAYSWTAGHSISTSAWVHIDVIHVDHAPVVGEVVSPHLFNGSDCGSSFCGLLLPFAAVDVDTTFTSTNFYRITTWPLLGDLYQVNDASLLGTQTIVDTLGLRSIPSSSSTTFAWAQAVMKASSQYSNCGPICFHLEDCPSSCTDLEYSAYQLLGPFNLYPKWADSPLAWSSAVPQSLDYIELDYGELMFVTSIEIYETWMTGTIVKVSVASEYAGNDTEWTVLWESTIGPSIPGTVARIFQPPLCACLNPIRYLRLDQNSLYGWPGMFIDHHCWMSSVTGSVMCHRLSCK
jgi:hypothetical protein